MTPLAGVCGCPVPPLRSPFSSAPRPHLHTARISMQGMGFDNGNDNAPAGSGAKKGMSA